MSRARMARRIATTAAYGGGGIGVLSGVAVGVLLAEVQLARQQIGVNEELPPSSDGRYGSEFGGPTRPPWRMAVLGDSTAAGVGVHHPSQTPGALLAAGLAGVSERPVDLRTVAVSGARSSDLARQVSLLLTDGEPVLYQETGAGPGAPTGRGTAHGGGRPGTVEHPPDVCVVIVGANDVTGRVPAARSVRQLSEAVTRLRAAGCQVVVATCPDLGTVEPVAQPLRWLARRLSRQLAAAQTIAVVELGGRTVSLGDLLGPEFAAHPHELFGPDRYHPSAEGYLTAAMALLPTLCAALSVWPEEERVRPERRESVLPVDRAAARAVAEGGTEVASAPALPRTPWALLKHRRRERITGSPPDRPAHADQPPADAQGTAQGDPDQPEAPQRDPDQPEARQQGVPRLSAEDRGAEGRGAVPRATEGTRSPDVPPGADTPPSDGERAGHQPVRDAPGSRTATGPRSVQEPVGQPRSGEDTGAPG